MSNNTITSLQSQMKIGSFIKQLRKDKGLTQKQFSELLETSQSAVARMERGGQNFTSKELHRISKVLNHNLISLSTTIDFKINGGKKLSGSITTNTSKNGAMGLMAASLLNKGTTTLRNMPRIKEVNRMFEIFESLGVLIKWKDESTLEIKPPKTFTFSKLNKESAGKVRSLLTCIGSFIHSSDGFNLPHAGGCKMGERTIAAHRYGLEEYGVKISTKEETYRITHNGLKPAKIIMYEAGDTAAINLLLAAARIKGETTISFAPSNYMVQEVCFFLEKLGVAISGIGTHKLIVHGVSNIKKDVEYHCSEDPIESMMFISAAIVTKSMLTIKRCPIDFLELELLKLEKMGLKYKRSKEYRSKNGRTKLVDLILQPSRMNAPDDKIHALPYPGINIDNLPFFVPIATQAKGQTLIHDWMWENRAIYFTELNRLGARIKLADPHRVYIDGPTSLQAAQIVCPPALRPAMIILIAMLGAKGTSILRNVYSIERGYQDVAERLRSIGADIEVIEGI